MESVRKWARHHLDEVIAAACDEIILGADYGQDLRSIVRDEGRTALPAVDIPHLQPAIAPPAHKHLE